MHMLHRSRGAERLALLTRWDIHDDFFLVPRALSIRAQEQSTADSSRVPSREQLAAVWASCPPFIGCLYYSTIRHCSQSFRFDFSFFIHCFKFKYKSKIQFSPGFGPDSGSKYFTHRYSPNELLRLSSPNFQHPGGASRVSRSGTLRLSTSGRKRPTDGI